MKNPELDKYVANRRKGDDMNKIKFDDLSVEEVNLIMMALAKQPFEQVAVLFGKLQQQAQAQLPQQPQQGAPLQVVK
jgi:hypothetical protein